MRGIQRKEGFQNGSHLKNIDQNGLIFGMPILGTYKYRSMYEI